MFIPQKRTIVIANLRLNYLLIILVKHTVSLKVGVETHLSWKVVRGQSGGNDNLHLSPILKLTEGDHVSIVCAAEEGFPVMQFSWEHHVVQQKEKENLENNTRARIGREYQVGTFVKV